MAAEIEELKRAFAEIVQTAVENSMANRKCSHECIFSHEEQAQLKSATSTSRHVRLVVFGAVALAVLGGVSTLLVVGTKYVLKTVVDRPVELPRGK